MARNKLDLDPLIKEFKRQKKHLPQKLGNVAVRYFRRSFDKEGFTDRTLDPWERRKYTARGGPKKTLQVSGALKRSIRRLKTTFGEIKIGTRGLAYAEIHNTGGTLRPQVTKRMRGFAWNKYKRTGNPVFKGIALTKKTNLTIEIPKRQYIGDSVVLEKLLKQRIEKEIRIFAAKQVK